MARSIQRWGPNTCGCKILQEHGDREPIVYRTRSEAQAIVDALRSRRRQTRKIQPEAILCPAHIDLGHTDLMYNTVLAENQTWNVTLSITRGFLPDITVEQYYGATYEEYTFFVTPEFEVEQVEEIGFRTSYDVNRVLQMDTSRLAFSAQDRVDLQDAVDLQFGPNKVLIV